MDVININQEKLSLIRRYPLEILVFMLCLALSFVSAVVYQLDQKTDVLQAEFKTYLMQDNKDLRDLIHSNTEALDRNSKIMEKLTDR